MPVKQKDKSKKVKKPRAPRKSAAMTKQKQIKQLVNVSVQSSGGSGGGGSSVPSFVPQTFKQGSGIGEDVRYENLVSKLMKDINQKIAAPAPAPREIPIVEVPNTILNPQPDLSNMPLVDKVAMETAKKPMEYGLDLDEEGIMRQRHGFDILREAEDEAINEMESDEPILSRAQKRQYKKKSEAEKIQLAREAALKADERRIRSEQKKLEAERKLQKLKGFA